VFGRRSLLWNVSTTSADALISLSSVQLNDFVSSINLFLLFFTKIRLGIGIDSFVKKNFRTGLKNIFNETFSETTSWS